MHPHNHFKASELESHHQIQFSVIPKTIFWQGGAYPSAVEAIGIFLASPTMC